METAKRPIFNLCEQIGGFCLSRVLPHLFKWAVGLHLIDSSLNSSRDKKMKGADRFGMLTVHKETKLFNCEIDLPTPKGVELGCIIQAVLASVPSKVFSILVFK